MAGLGVVGQREPVAHRVVPVDHADHVVGEQLLPAQRGGGLEHGHGDVGPAPFEVRERALVPLLDADLQVGRGQEQLGQQVRAQGRDRVVRGDDPHDPRRRGGVEALARDEPFQPRQELGELALHLPRPRGQLVLAAGPDQQLVAEQRPQPLQRPAHRRLAQVEPPRGPRHVPLLEHDGQGTQVVQQPEITVRHAHSMPAGRTPTVHVAQRTARSRRSREALPPHDFRHRSQPVRPLRCSSFASRARNSSSPSTWSPIPSRKSAAPSSASAISVDRGSIVRS